MAPLPTLLAADPAALRAIFERGLPVPADALDDTWYRGVSLGLWGWVEALTWKTFAKTFHRDPATGELRGWNVRLHQDGLDAAPRPLEKGGTPLTFGHYVVRVGSGGTVIDYGAGGNRAFDLTRLLRDPIVALDAHATRLLGYSAVRLAGREWATPSWFLLERAGALPFVAWPPVRGGASSAPG